MDKLRVLDLFSGIGGFSLGLERTGGFETIAFCEIEEKYAQKILRKHWPDVPIHNDIRKLDGSEIDADVITGGYPCQPFSNAGKRGGTEDDRHLWPEMYRLIKAIRPRWVIAENVYGHISVGLDQVLSDLEGINYTWWTFIVPACAVDAPHRRDRVWIIANTGLPEPQGRQEPETDHDRCSGAGIQEGSESSSPCSSVADPRCNAERSGERMGGDQTQRSERGSDIADCGEDVADPGSQGPQVGEQRQAPSEGEGATVECEFCGYEFDAICGRYGCPNCLGGEVLVGNVAYSESIRVEGCGAAREQESSISSEKRIPGRDCAGIGEGRACAEWAVEPPVGRVADGIPRRVDRLKGLGNAVVPQIPEQIGYAILEAENEKQKAITGS